MLAAYLLPLGHWGHLVLMGFWGPTSLSCLPIARVKGQPYFPDQTPPLSCIFRGVPLTHSFLVVPTYLVPLLGRDLLAKLGASISFAPSIHLNTSSPAVPLLLLLASQPTNTTMLFPLLDSLVDPQVWDVTKHHSPVVIQLLDSTSYTTQTQYPISVQSLRGLKPIISDLLRKKLLCLTSVKEPNVAEQWW